MDAKRVAEGLKQRLGYSPGAHPTRQELLTALDRELEQLAQGDIPRGIVNVPHAELEMLRAQAGWLREAQDGDLDRAVDDAVQKGKILATSADHWRDLIAENPEMLATLAGFPEGMVGPEVAPEAEIYRLAWPRSE